MNAPKPLAVLIVEDSYPQREHITAVIRAAGAKNGVECNIEVATSVVGAISKLTNSFIPQLIFLDHRLPGPSGLEFLRYLVDQTLPIRVFVASGYLMEDSDSEHRKVYEAYNELKSEFEAKGGRLDICDKHHLPNIDVLLSRLVGELASSKRAGRKLNLGALDYIVAVSPAMKTALESIKVFLKRWQHGERNLLILHGPRGAGKRFLASCVSQVFGISDPGGKFGRESRALTSPEVFNKALSSLTPKNLKDGYAGLRIQVPGGAPDDWSHIIPNIAAFGDAVIQSTIDAVIKFPDQPFILPFDDELDGNALNQLQEALRSIVVTVRVPLLRDRSDDVPGLARFILEEISRERTPQLGSPSLGRVAEDGLRKCPPSSYAVLKSVLRIAVNRLPAGATEISISDIPISPHVVERGRRPERPGEITDECEERVITLLKALKKATDRHHKTLKFDRSFEERPDDEKRAIRALSYIAAEKLWRGQTRTGGKDGNIHPSQYPTIFGVKWANVMKNHKGVGGRNEVIEFAKRHEAYFLWLAKFGPEQPSPVAD